MILLHVCFWRVARTIPRWNVVTWEVMTELTGEVSSVAWSQLFPFVSIQCPPQLERSCLQRELSRILVDLCWCTNTEVSPKHQIGLWGVWAVFHTGGTAWWLSKENLNVTGAQGSYGRCLLLLSEAQVITRKIGHCMLSLAAQTSEGSAFDTCPNSLC